MEIWLVFSLLSTLCLAGLELAQKSSLTQKTNISVITNNFLIWTFQGITGLLLARIWGQLDFNLNQETLLKILVVGVIYFVGGTAFYASYKGNSSSISIILGMVSIVGSSVLGVVFLADKFTNGMIIGAVLIMIAIIVLNLSPQSKLSKYNLYAILGGMCYGVAYTIDKSIVTTISALMYLGLMSLAVALISFAIRGIKIINELKTIKNFNFKTIVLAGIFGSGFNLLTYLAYRYGANVGVADVLNNSAVFIVITFEILIFRDRSNLRLKLLMGILALCGVFFIGFM